MTDRRRTDQSRRFRVTYATLSADNDDLHAAYEQGLQAARSWFGSTLPVYVDGESRTTGEAFEVRSPVDTSIVLCWVHSATPADVADAVAAARRASGSWAGTPWQERVTLLRRAADLISERSNELAALMAWRSARTGWRRSATSRSPPTSSATTAPDGGATTASRPPMDRLPSTRPRGASCAPYGVWAVISPFNFPMALAGGPAGGALVGRQHRGAQAEPRRARSPALKLYECLRDAGVPAGALHVVTGPGDDGRRRLWCEPGRRRADVHRLVRGRHGDLPELRDGATPSRSSARWAARTP